MAPGHRRHRAAALRGVPPGDAGRDRPRGPAPLPRAALPALHPGDGRRHRRAVCVPDHAGAGRGHRAGEPAAVPSRRAGDGGQVEPASEGMGVSVPGSGTSIRSPAVPSDVSWMGPNTGSMRLLGAMPTRHPMRFGSSASGIDLPRSRPACAWPGPGASGSFRVWRQRAETPRDLSLRCLLDHAHSA